MIIGRATSNGKVFEDTKERGKPIVFRYGARPFTGGLCQGVEEALSTMKAGADALLLSFPVLPRRVSWGKPCAMHVENKDLSGSTRCCHVCAQYIPSGLCIATYAMAWPGGIRVVTVPPQLGFGDQGAVLRPTEHVPDKQGEVPPGATLEYELSLIRVSIPPS